MDDPDAGVETLLLGGLQRSQRRAHMMDLVDEFVQRRVVLRRVPGQRMVGGDRHERRAEDGVGPRRIDLELALAGRRGACRDRPADQQPFGAADPVLLHDADLFRPAVERVEAVEQLLRHRRDLEEPLRQVALFDRRAGAPAMSVDDLLVGEHGHVDRIPVDLGGLALDQPGAPEIDEQFLLMLVVAGVAGRDLAGPVQRQAHRLQLAPHRRDVGIGPVARIDLVVARRIFRGQAERIPSHRMQDVEAHGTAETRHHVAHRVVAHMADVDAPRRIGKHLEHVVFRARIVVRHLEKLRLVPRLLPAGFGRARIVSFGCHQG